MLLPLLPMLLLLPVERPASLGAVPADGVRVFLLRHGQAYSNLDPAPDLPEDQLDRLTELGHEQARRVAAFLRGQGVVEVQTSPAGRARETAEEIGKALGLHARVEPKLRPLGLGRAPDGTALDWDRRIAEWEAGKDPSPPGGESLEQLGARVYDASRSLVGQRDGKSVLLVAHSEVIAALMGEINGVPGAKRWPPKLRNGSLTVVDMGGKQGARIRLVDYVPGDSHAGAP
jgi:probable phosphoglycerate mutase